MADPAVISVKKIWGGGAHCAFTDLARFRGRWFCVFREAATHVGSEGSVRIIESSDGATWRSTAVLSETGTDLRDPKLSVTPGKNLMLLMGGTPAGAASSDHRQPRVAFSTDGRLWSLPQRVLCPGDWLWRVTWHRSRGYGVSYRLESARTWRIILFETRDGAEYRQVCPLDVSGKPNETTVRFCSDGRAFALVRREGGDAFGWIGSSVQPYRQWTWRPAGRRVGGPNFIILPDSDMWAVCRDSTSNGPATRVFRMGNGSLRPALTLPSGGDCSYPGLAWFRGMLWVSYYSSHEGTTSIYLARVRLA
ncbi:MAG TPA: exo-alpha-sialidase [Spirochaetia bacterium]|nr:exo-alpha-sialidase [Spirochaetia bacterium]